jgi:hypothetical protein
LNKATYNPCGTPCFALRCPIFKISDIRHKMNAVYQRTLFLLSHSCFRATHFVYLISKTTGLFGATCIPTSLSLPFDHPFRRSHKARANPPNLFHVPYHPIFIIHSKRFRPLWPGYGHSSFVEPTSVAAGLLLSIESVAAWPGNFVALFVSGFQSPPLELFSESTSVLSTEPLTLPRPLCYLLMVSSFSRHYIPRLTKY